MDNDTFLYLYVKKLKVIEKIINKNIKGRLRGVRMYKISNGKLKEVFIENIEEKACDVVNRNTYMPYICEYGLKGIKDKFVTYHTNVHKVYNTILSNPFAQNKLSPQDVILRKDGVAPFNILEKGTHGTIYTEKDNPLKIKYLKVQNYKTPNRYSFYGNTQNNTFECKSGKDCEMYGGGGDDEFIQKIQRNNLYIKDFKENDNDGDKIFLPKGYSDITATRLNANTINILAKYTSKNQEGDITKYVKVILEDTTWSLGEVEGWVDVATGKYRESEEGKKLSEKAWLKKQVKNPIQI